MTTLKIELDEQQTKRLQEVADRLKVSMNDLAKAAVNDLVARPEAEFDQAANRVLQKNAELYKRLA
ncbi:MAG: DNA-binding protein [Thermosynechococcaceae cyanobacterium]